jgi:uncharacterized protein (TIGR02246 family)
VIQPADDITMKTSSNTNHSNEKLQVVQLYQHLLKSWNDRDADAYADLFTEDGNIIGFDGSQGNGKKDIRDHLARVFADHQTGTYVSIVQEVRFLNTETALLRAVAGMIPHGKSDINPAINAIQTLIAQKTVDGFRIAVFQNTPAAFHGQPESSEWLTKELRKVLATTAFTITSV